jgi:hypothetical protein
MNTGQKRTTREHCTARDIPEQREGEMMEQCHQQMWHNLQAKKKARVEHTIKTQNDMIERKKSDCVEGKIQSKTLATKEHKSSQIA